MKHYQLLSINYHQLTLFLLMVIIAKQPTLNYFNQLLKISTQSTIFIFDDIHWSVEMEEAWNEIKQHPSVTLNY